MPVDFLDFDPDGDVVLILNYCSVDWNNLASLEEEEEDDDDKDTDSEPHDDTEMEQKLHVRASSKHLKLASPVFRAMFRAEFREGAMVDSGASPNISLLDDDSIALLIILCVIHGHTKILPHQINLSLLAQIAVLADKYNLESYLSFFANLWIEQLKSNMPTSLTTKAFKWLTISWVFKRPSEFEIVTKIAVRESKWRLDNDPRMHLTIPKSIPDVIDSCRTDALVRALDLTQSLLRDYQGPAVHCKLDKGLKCDAMVLGGLTRGLNACGLLNPPPVSQSRYSFTNLAQDLQSMSLPVYYEVHGYSRADHYACGVKRKIDDFLENLQTKLTGLSLEQFERG